MSSRDDWCKMEKGKADTRILRWNYRRQTGALFKRYSPENPGKHITDNNPYLEIDVEKFDYYSELHPLPMLVAGMYARRYMNKLMKNMFNTEYGKGLMRIFRKKYKMRIGIDILRQKLETKGLRKPKVAERKEQDLALLKQEIIEFARKHEFIPGFTKVDRRYIADEKDAIFPYDTVLILGRKMEKEQVMEIPHPGYKTRKLYNYETYKEAGQRVHYVADFIRSKGYRCLARASLDGMMKFGPHAVNAGIGQYTTCGFVVTPELGTSLRFCSVNIDADIPIDHPRDLNADEFCSRCRLCQKCCPEVAIPKDAFEWRGAIKRKVHDKKCLSSNFSPENPLCGICLKVCPYNNFGYEECMDKIPQYYRYNTMDDAINKAKLGNIKRGE